MLALSPERAEPSVASVAPFLASQRLAHENPNWCMLFWAWANIELALSAMTVWYAELLTGWLRQQRLRMKTPLYWSMEWRVLVPPHSGRLHGAERIPQPPTGR